MATETTQTVAAGMLVLQEVAVGPTQDRAARRHGRALLGLLSRLQHHLLGGADADAVVDDLATLVEAAPCTSDSGLAAALDAATLRARVELARRGR